VSVLIRVGVYGAICRSGPCTLQHDAKVDMMHVISSSGVRVFVFTQLST
jgi:hypothetical protein